MSENKTLQYKNTIKAESVQMEYKKYKENMSNRVSWHLHKPYKSDFD